MENREIKFRGWNTTTSKMVDLHAIAKLALSDGMQEDGLYIPFVDNIVLMQYTGLKDKNGVDIFEGDIVKCSYGTGTVIWQEPIAAYLVSWVDDVEANMEFLGLERTKRRCRFEEDEVFEIIGNIHQNPDLCSA